MTYPISQIETVAKIINTKTQEAYGINDRLQKMAQVLCVVEEAGEFAGAFRRHQGLARRNGSFEDMASELADVVISAFTAAEACSINLPAEIARKIDTIMMRGWKETT